LLTPFANQIINAITEKTYIVRTNISSDKYDAVEMTKNLYDNNYVSINIDTVSEKKEYQYWKDLKNGLKIKHKYNYIKFFYNLLEDVKKQDVLVYASFAGEKYKLGLIKKGTLIEEEKINEHIFLKLKMVSVEKFEKYKYPILETYIPQQVAVQNIKKGNEKIKSIYYGFPIIPKLENLSSNETELICAEWLRSDLCPKEYKIKYQLLLNGKNYPNIDIYGKTYDNKVIVAQITISESKGTILSKNSKLEAVEADIKLIFGQNNDINLSNYISIQEVWKDLYNDKKYKEMIEFLFKK